MNRKLTVGERIMYVEATSHVNCVFPVKIRGRIQLEKLENALSKLQNRHPLLRVVIREDEKGRPYYVSDTRIGTIPVQIIERYTNDDWQKVSVQEWYNPFNVHQGPLARLIWLRADSVSELLLVCPHCICDGTSILTLVRDLLQALDEPYTELPPYETFGRIEDLLSPAVLANKKLQIKGKVISWITGAVLWLKMRDKHPDNGQGYLLHWKLTEELSAALVRRCKEEDTSLYATISVAFLEAFKSIRGDKAHGKQICPVDIRRFLPEIKPYEMFAFAPIVELTVEKSALTDFWTKTRKFRNDLTAKIDVINIHEMMLMGEYFHASAPRLVSFLKTSDGTHDVTLSNMGRLQLPENYQTFELETVYSPSAGFPWRNPNTLVSSAFRGQIDFSFISNEKFLPENDARAIREKTVALLQEKSRATKTYGVVG